MNLNKYLLSLQTLKLKFGKYLEYYTKEKI